MVEDDSQRFHAEVQQWEEYYDFTESEINPEKEEVYVGNGSREE